MLKSRKGKPLDFEQIEKEIEKLCKKFGIELFYIFGSYAKGKATPLSDLDVAFLARRKINTLSLLAELEKIFEEEAIEVIDLKRAPLHLIFRVLKEGKCLYAESLEKKIEFETRALCLYYDMENLREEYFAKLEQEIEHGPNWHR